MVHFKFSIATAFIFALAVLSKPAPLTPDPSGTKNIGNGNNNQFIGGQCLSSADCGSGGSNACCAVLPTADGTIGICSGLGAQTQAGKQGCGFGDGGSASESSSPSSVAAVPAVASGNAGSCTGA